MSSQAVGAAMAVVMFVGAANDDAGPEQRARLREAIKPLEDESLTASQAYETVMRQTVEIMGPDWRPSGEWDEWITALLADGSER